MAEFDPIAYINEPRWRNSSLGLDRMRMLMDKLGNPQDGLRFVHVAGTNGKGSTCAYIASILMAAGCKTGLFTSPYIETFEERIRINGANIPLDDLRRITLRVRDAAEQVEMQDGQHPTEFELMCAVALMYFADQDCDWVVAEVGLGGRLDATNIIAPDLCVLTPISLDHTDILGDTLVKIAGEKAGIIKPGVPVVSWPQEAEAMEVVSRRCADLGCPLSVPDLSQLSIGNVDVDKGVRSFSYMGVLYRTRMLARYQPMNAALAIEAGEILHVSKQSICKGIESAEWPGRFEVVLTKPLVIVDGSHNPQGAQALASSLEEITSRSVTFVVGMLADKDCAGIIAPLLPLASRFIAYTPSNPRALSAEDLAGLISHLSDVPVNVVASPQDAIVDAVSTAGADDVVVACGTLYSIGEIKGALHVFGLDLHKMASLRFS